ncbi:MAG TPA: adenylate/guanylate cyclase domain-containing protein [Acidimicrobiales bacterium]|nr:adenylate/guanylate cyclase domain-containing protein [Acidimicrobiales bacterium]
MSYTARELADRAGIDIELAKRLWTAMGFPLPGEHDATYNDEDVAALQYAGELIRSHSVEPELLIQLTRTMASSIARIAEAQLEVAVDRARRFDAEQGVLVDDKVVEMTPWLLGYMWRRHAAASFGRAVEAVAHEEAALGVGFADLVGFTALSQELPEQDLASLVSRFEALAHDTIVLLGGRVVKMIGDEVMFAVDDLKSGLEISLSLADAYSDDEQLQDVRVGFSCGNVLQLQGDLYGPPVNLASRIVSIARPRSVVVSEAVHDALGEDPDYAWRSLRPRTFKGIGRVPIWRVRRREQ